MAIQTGVIERLIQDELRKARDLALLAAAESDTDIRRVLMTLVGDTLLHAERLLALSGRSRGSLPPEKPPHGGHVVGYLATLPRIHRAVPVCRGGDFLGLHRLFHRVPGYSSGVVLR